jgi:hypothetical protein
MKDVFNVEENTTRFEEGRINLLRAFMVWRAVH